jgi:hypothetical protein
MLIDLLLTPTPPDGTRFHSEFTAPDNCLSTSFLLLHT